jgi:molecular chaperone GrpE
MSKDKADDKNVADEEGTRPEFGDDAEGGDRANAAPSTEEKLPESEETESDRYLRLAADFDNYRKRTAREFDEITRSANARLLQSLVTVVDDFERALVEEAARGEVDAYRQGVELIYGKLQGLLTRERVTVMDVLGKPFDPAFHEALMQQRSDEYPDGVICGVVQKGYLLGDKVLRHARVIVSGGRGAVDDEKNETE